MKLIQIGKEIQEISPPAQRKITVKELIDQLGINIENYEIIIGDEVVNDLDRIVKGDEVIKVVPKIKAGI
jgi:sulfur carrier protein ThiS